MSFRPGFRAFTAAFRPAFRQPSSILGRRYAGTGTGAEIPNPATEQKGFAKFWNSKVGPKTVHFWAPIMKWSIVLAGAADLTRPASQLSLTQNAALTATGAIWTRWCFVIRPQNIFLATVNFFLFIVGATQVTRILMYQQSLKGVEGQAKGEGEKLKEGLKAIEEKVKSS